MRKLFLMIGAPASGKSYWIKQHNLQYWTVSADELRNKMAGFSLSINPDNNEIVTAMSHHAEPEVWKTLEQEVASRMYHGQTTFIDNTNLFNGAFKPWNKLRNKYCYEVYGIDCMAPLIQKVGKRSDAKELVVEMLKTNNRDRQFEVPDEALERYTDRYFEMKRSNNFPDWLHMINANDEEAINKALGIEYIDNMERFNRIQVIGDIHADYDALMKVFESHKPGTAYCFVGDYLDRGVKTLETFKFVTQDLGGSNLFFCFGNHEDGWQKWEADKEKHGQFQYLSLPKLLDAYDHKKLDKILHNFIKNTQDYFAFKYFGKTYFVSHAGFEPEFINDFKVGLLPRNAFVYGLGNKGVKDPDAPYARDIDYVWHNAISDKFVNLHGHRNNFNRFCEGNSYNLTADGKFRWLTITKDGIEPHEIDRIDVPSFGEELEQEPHIHQRELADGIKANNFDKSTFYQNIWNRLTIRSRGLFTRQDDIVGRGFNKFFAVGQLGQATLDSLEYPVTIERKHDGFLGVVFYDKEKNKIDVYSKGGSDSYSALAKGTLKSTGWYSKIEKYFADEATRDTTLLFEIIDPEEDIHVIKYNEKHTYPLAIISNNMDGTVLNLAKSVDKKLQNSEEFQSMKKQINDIEIWKVAHNRKELDAYIAEYGREYATREGVVLYGQNKMLKIKLPYYLKAKELRGAIHQNGKKMWWYGAKHWWRLCKKHKITVFTPDLPLLIYKYYETDKLDEMLDNYAKAHQESQVPLAKIVASPELIKRLSSGLSGDLHV